MKSRVNKRDSSFTVKKSVTSLSQLVSTLYDQLMADTLLPFRMRAEERKGSGNISFIGGKTLHPILQTLQHISSAAFLVYVSHIHDQSLNFSKISFGKLLTQFSNSSKGKKKLESILVIYQN